MQVFDLNKAYHPVMPGLAVAVLCHNAHAGRSACAPVHTNNKNSEIPPSERNVRGQVRQCGRRSMHLEAWRFRQPLRHSRELLLEEFDYCIHALPASLH
mmetsp:Transcript_140492/g.365425  ORF Transcript_140492/g.365425 Transcript_140492/m.365425 type:complete len:99 (+) Transcript_140492:128-424(+)